MNSPDAFAADACVNREPVGLDHGRPMIARIYNYFLGGSEYYDDERILCTKLLGQVPDVGFVFQSEIEFLQRAARWIATKFKRVEQWVIAVPGLSPNFGDLLHKHVHRMNPDARIWYVDYEPVTLAVLRTLDADGGKTGPINVVEADPLNPEAVWAGLHDQTTPLDKDEPVCLILGGSLTYHPFSRVEAAAVAQLHIKNLPPGSFVVLTHLFEPEAPDLAATARQLHEELHNGPLNAGSIATREEIEAMVAGTAILQPAIDESPGVVPAYLWWRDGPALRPDPPTGQLVAAVVASIPGD
ncbi:SAM-dependent methyltransferase [Amycolatopsis australiensis]|uniref:S-adenosyl methyltransferase n=1 Tax=Amycolatopsis australiensis TaxID=546364 RepID=A0A1K1LS52_9PSEU|nr:SAM-dependent methyltransferase [Amycolatopsis australiensis]SFW13695.1 S-adenosyl methyltransferase [Amycolatopsis australiensis]